MTLLPSAESVGAPNRDEIVRVVQLYIDGFNDCDVEKFKQAFHEDAWIFFTHRDGTLYKGLIADSFEEWATPPAQRIEAESSRLLRPAISRPFFSASTMPTTYSTGGWTYTRCFASMEPGRS
jgi:Putative lumazine-binding